MENFSTDWIWIFAIIVLVLFIKMRRNRQPSIIRGKHISIIGKKVLTTYRVDTPLICLLSDNKNFGPDYLDKHDPELPHTEGCKCYLIDLSYSSIDLFQKKKEKIPLPETDLGQLSDTERRYYRYRLISIHKDASKEQQHNFLDLSKHIEIDEDFKQRVREHLQKQVKYSGETCI